MHTNTHTQRHRHKHKHTPHMHPRTHVRMLAHTHTVYIQHSLEPACQVRATSSHKSRLHPPELCRRKRAHCPHLSPTLWLVQWSQKHSLAYPALLGSSADLAIGTLGGLSRQGIPPLQGDVMVCWGRGPKLMHQYIDRRESPLELALCWLHSSSTLM